MTPIKYIARIVNLEPLDYKIIRDFAQEKGLGGKGFSAALRIIVRDWHSLRLLAMSDEKYRRIQTSGSPAYRSKTPPS